MAWYSRVLLPDDLEFQRGLPSPQFRVGTLVRALVGNLNGFVVKTELTAKIAQYSWHWKHKTWMYKLAVVGGRRNRCYLESQLVLVGES
jgi:hypothetical protein